MAIKIVMLFYANKVSYKYSYSYLILLVFVFVWVEALRPSQQFFCCVGTNPPLPRYYQYFLEADTDSEKWLYM